jgi:putative peptidoglycan lipid II flippase
LVLLRRRLGVGLGRIAFFVLPAAIGYLLLGRPLVAMLYQTGRFGAEETALVTGILAAYGVGLLASASVKLLASGFYALRDTRTPVKVAVGSLAVGTVSGFLLLTRTPLGPAGIALGSAIGAWAYFLVMLHLLQRRLGTAVIAEPERQVLGRIGVALVPAALIGFGATRALDGMPVVIEAVTAWSLFGLTYLAAAWLLGLDQARDLARRLGVRGGRP